METYTTKAARQELALRDAAKNGNRHMRRKGTKFLRDVPPPSPWFVFEHPTFGTMGIRPTGVGTQVEMRLPQGIPNEERVAVIEWGIEQMKQLGTQPAIDPPADQD